MCHQSGKKLCCGRTGGAACPLQSPFLMVAEEGKKAFCICRRGLEYRLTVLFLASCVLPSLAVLALPVYASNHKVGTPALGSFWCPVWRPAWQCSPSHSSHQVGAPQLTLLRVSRHLLSLAILTLLVPRAKDSNNQLERCDPMSADMDMLWLHTNSFLFLWSWPAALQCLRVAGEPLPLVQRGTNC